MYEIFKNIRENEEGKYMEIILPDFGVMNMKDVNGSDNPWARDRCCVYFLFNDSELVYIGRTTNLEQRINQHKSIKQIKKQFNKVFYIDSFNGREQRLLENIYIELYQPKYNEHRDPEQYINWNILLPSEEKALFGEVSL